jgi:hypothetical protein
MPNEQYLPNIHYYGNKTSIQGHEQYIKNNHAIQTHNSSMTFA